MGHEPKPGLSAQDETLLKAFQHNLLSLISHELKTPLMGVMNALTLMEEHQQGTLGQTGMSPEEMLQMARGNAQRLNRALSSLLDLANLEAGLFHVRLKEIQLWKVAQAALQDYHRNHGSSGLTVTLAPESSSQFSLADPQKLKRAIELCLESLSSRAQAETAVELAALDGALQIRFRIRPDLKSLWDEAWTQAEIAKESRMVSSVSMFAGTLQSEQGFLSRAEEGLGSELLLIHEILRLHHGQFKKQEKGLEIDLRLELPELDPEEKLALVLQSRISELSVSIQMVLLCLIAAPEGAAVDLFTQKVQAGLFRSSDAAYALPGRGVVALLLDDCRPEDLKKLLSRLESSVGIPLLTGAVTLPSDGTDVPALLALAARRLADQKK